MILHGLTNSPIHSIVNTDRNHLSGSVVLLEFDNREKMIIVLRLNPFRRRKSAPTTIPPELLSGLPDHVQAFLGGRMFEDIMRPVDKEETSSINQLVIKMQDMYLNDAEAQETLDLMLVELPLDSYLRRQCTEKHAWMRREISGLVTELTAKDDQLDGMPPEMALVIGGITRRPLYERLVVCQQTMTDIQAAAKGEPDNSVFKAKHPSCQWPWARSAASNLEGLTAARAKTDHKMQLAGTAMGSEAQKRFAANNLVHKDLKAMMYCRDPQQLLQEITKVRNEYKEIRTLVDVN